MKDKIKEYADLNSMLGKMDDESVLNENANKDSKQYHTMINLTAGLVGKSEGIKMLPRKVALAHIEGDIHFHDLSESPRLPMTNCSLVDFKTMFENGFKIGNAEVSSPKSIQTATAQMAQVIASVSSSQYGGTSIDRIDELLAPFAEMNHEKHVRELNHLVISWLNDKNKEEILDRVEKMALEKTYKDIYDAIQSLEYEINTLFTSNGQ